MPAFRRGIARNGLLCIPVALLLCGLLVWFAIFLYATKIRWQHIITELDRREHLLESRVQTRRCIRGTPIPGEAWAEYEQAITAFPAARPCRYPGAGLNRAECMEVVKSRMAAVAAFRRGVSASNTHRSLTGDPENRLSLTIGADNLSQWMRCYAGHLEEIGEGTEGIELIMDVALFGIDIAQSSLHDDWVVGTHIVEDSLADIVAFIRRGKLDSRNLAFLEHGLQVLDSTFPSYLLALQLEPVEQAHRLLKYGHPHEAALLSVPYWDRAKAVNALDTHLTMSEAQAEAYKKGWSALTTTWEAMAEANRGSSNGYLRGTMRSLLQPSALAHIRILRTLVHFALHGEVRALPDPYGTDIRSRLSLTTLCLWSVGSDGVDDGGKVGADHRSDDIVLEVELTAFQMGQRKGD